VGTGRRLREGSDVAVLSIGPIGNDVESLLNDESLVLSDSTTETEKSHSTLNKKHITPAHYDMRFLKPLDEDILHEVGKKFSRIITVEDGVRTGGLGSAVLEWMSDHGYSPTIQRLGLPDVFVEHGTVSELHQIVGLDVESIKKAIVVPHPSPNTQQP
jgi:1-deoxy-D-xylulose-5-phosphate synthase